MPRPDRRRPPARSGPTSLLWLGILVLVILGGGAILAVLKKREASAQAAGAETPAAEKPFADLPPEEPPPRRAGSADTPEPFGSPESLLSDPVWQRAVELAGQGEEHYRAALDAKTRGDVPTLNARGNQAKKAFDEALESTAQLEEELIAARGETDPLVRDVMRTRNGWFDRVRWLHKSTSR
jgi:hypothetical protein